MTDNQNDAMNEIDLKQLWQSAQKAGGRPKKYTMQDIMLYRKRQSKETTRGILWGIQFDMILKGMLVLGFGLLLLLLPESSPARAVSYGVITLTLALIYTEFQFVYSLDLMSDADSILDSLRQKLAYLRRYYRPFIFLAALTNPILMLCGFFFYFYFTYGEIRMESPVEDPVLYLLLMVGYLLGLAGFYPFYQSRRRVLSECLHDLTDEEVGAQVIADQERRKRRFVLMAAILVLVGLLFFLLLLLY